MIVALSGPGSAYFFSFGAHLFSGSGEGPTAMFHLRVIAVWFLQLVVLPCAVTSTLQAASSATVSPITPLQAELVAPLDISHVHIGSPVPVRVDLEWAASGCILRAGSIVQGHVVELTKRSKGVKDSELQLVFDAADCEDHHESSFLFTLVAVVGVGGGSPSTGQSGVSEAPPLADAIGNAIGGPGGIRSAQTASAINSGFNLPVRRLPSQILPGQVLGVRKTVLSVGTGEKGATIIKGLGHNVRLEQGTSLILTHGMIITSASATAKTNGRSTATSDRVPSRPGGFSMSATGGGGSELVATGISRAEKTTAPTSADVVPVPEPIDETSICTGLCNVIGGSASEGNTQDSAAIASIPLKRWGYSPRNKREAVSFDYETNLIYLDSHNLLCTFDPHQLRERVGFDQEAVHTIRVVLVDPETYSIKQVMEWRVRGDKQYLWRLADGKFLVHVGRELREFGVQLKMLRSIPLDGKVAWVVASPTGDHIAVGTVRERYSQAALRDLEAVLPSPPEEDIEVRVFNKDNAVILTAQQSSKLPQPVLSDSGELRLHGDGHTHWKISEYRWDRTEHPIAATTSACRPLLTTLARDLIFAVGCTSSGGWWYRMLRADGHPLLKGESASNEIQHYAEGTVGGDFAVRTIKAVSSMSYGQPFTKADLAQEKIAIYRNQDGAHLATVATSDFALSQLAFALSPTGDQIAIIGNSSILFYPVHLH